MNSESKHTLCTLYDGLNIIFSGFPELWVFESNLMLNPNFILNLIYLLNRLSFWRICTYSRYSLEKNRRLAHMSIFSFTQSLAFWIFWTIFLQVFLFFFLIFFLWTSTLLPGILSSFLFQLSSGVKCLHIGGLNLK